MNRVCPADELALYAYDFLEGADRDRLEAHLSSCPACRDGARDLLDERSLVAFALASEAEDVAPPPPSAADTAPVRRIGIRAPTRRIGLVVPILAAAAAAIVILAGVRVFFPPVATPPSPPAEDWTRLADGSRYRALDRARVRPGLRRLEVDEGSLVVDVRRGEEEFEVATPFGSVKSDGGRFAMAVSASGAFVEVLSGDARLLPREGEERRLWSGPPDAPPRIHVVEIDPNPELLRRIEELEAKLAELTAAAEPPPETPEEAIARHDWGGLADALLGAAPDLRAGKLPEDPAVLERLARSLSKLRRMAAAAGISPDLDTVARDPRTGPRLFAEVVRRAWPDAPASDVAEAEEAAREAMTRYGERVAGADTPAARAAAVEELRQGLSGELEQIEEQQGPPAVDVSPVIPAATSQPIRETGKLEKTSDARTPDSLLAAAGVGAGDDRVVTGTSEEIARTVAAAWFRVLGNAAPSRADLLTIARAWVQDYADVLDRVASDLELALESRLSGAASAWDRPDSELSRLKSVLLETQATAERRLLRGLDDAARARFERASAPTYFLLSR